MAFDHKRLALFLLVSLTAVPALAHNVNYALQDAPNGAVVGYYTRLGIEHIIPLGLDHILFIVGLCLTGGSFRSLLWQATAFTLAHSITLGLSMAGTITLPSAIVEPVIALSIAFIALDNLMPGRLRAYRVAVVFVFGLIHGLGFASVLNEVGLPPGRFLTALLSFNLGVEIGQVIVIALTYGLLVWPFRHRQSFQRRIALPLSIGIALVAGYWAVERIWAV